jgi:hypothetical protein
MAPPLGALSKGGSPGGTARATTETEGDPQSRTAADHPGTPREG